VLDVVSTYIEEHIGNIRNFRAVLADPSKTEGTISIGNNPIARVTGEILQSLGGDYARLVKQKKKKIQKRKTQYKPQKIVECQTPGGDNLQLFKRKKKGVHKPPRRVEVQQINLNTPSRRIIIHAVRILKKGGIIVYPTDTIYGLAADIYNKSAISHIYKIKKVSKQKLMTLIFSDLKGIGDWVHVPRPAFRVMRRVLPGKYTFILPANIEVQKLIFPKRRTLGIRIPDNEVSRLLVEKLGNPLISTSVPKDKNDFFTDPYEIAERFKYEIDLVLDAGLMPNLQSTIVDCTVEPPEILREGAGDVDDLFGI
jgi:tRNA threonylcarbamoyl adenosine modification protein (Sua5/YciO/YrdC/YwlC family)